MRVFILKWGPNINGLVQESMNPLLMHWGNAFLALTPRYFNVNYFSGNDPATDLRGSGFLGLMQLLYLVTEPSLYGLAKDIYCLSLHETQVQCAHYINGLVQDCSNSIALAMELLQSCTKPLISCCHSCYWDRVLLVLQHIGRMVYPSIHCLMASPAWSRYFQMHFLRWKIFYFDSNFTEVCSPGPIDSKFTLVQVMATRHQSGDKPLSDPVLTQIWDVIWHY